MKKFLQVTGWIIVAFVCFYLMGLGERTPRRSLEDRMDNIEEYIREETDAAKDLIRERCSEIESELEELRSAQDAEKYEREDETERIREKLGEIQAALDETAGTTEYILEMIEEYHPE